jgi:hypothetical protein
MVAPSLYRALYLACTYANGRIGITHCTINIISNGWNWSSHGAQRLQDRLIPVLRHRQRRDRAVPAARFVG